MVEGKPTAAWGQGRGQRKLEGPTAYPRVAGTGTWAGSLNKHLKYEQFTACHIQQSSREVIPFPSMTKGDANGPPCLQSGAWLLGQAVGAGGSLGLGAWSTAQSTPTFEARAELGVCARHGRCICVAQFLC